MLRTSSAATGQHRREEPIALQTLHHRLKKHLQFCIESAVVAASPGSGEGNRRAWPAHCGSPERLHTGLETEGLCPLGSFELQVMGNPTLSGSYAKNNNNAFIISWIKKRTLGSKRRSTRSSRTRFFPSLCFSILSGLVLTVAGSPITARELLQLWPAQQTQ